jgi:hypothetical protein
MAQRSAQDPRGAQSVRNSIAFGIIPDHSSARGPPQSLRIFRLPWNANDHSSMGAQPLVDPPGISGIVLASIQGHLHLRISPQSVAQVCIQLSLIPRHQNNPQVITPRGLGPGRTLFSHTGRAEQTQGHLRDTRKVRRLRFTRSSKFRRGLSLSDESCWIDLP